MGELRMMRRQFTGFYLKKRQYSGFCTAELRATVAGAQRIKTLTLHRGFNAHNPRMRGIIHTHSTHLLALTLPGAWGDGDVLRLSAPFHVVKTGHVPRIRDRCPRDPTMGRSAALADRDRGVLLEGVGRCCGSSR